MKKVKAKDKIHLKTLIQEEITKRGPGANLNFINTSKITDMSGLFENSIFNGYINEWDTSNVINMECMFQNARFFNQRIDKWDTSNVRSMYAMFQDAHSFNQPIGNWIVYNVSYLYNMFYNARSFNQDISTLYTSKGKFGIDIFYNCPMLDRFGTGFSQSKKRFYY